MPIKIEFAGDQPEKRQAKTYTGNVKDWPDGLYAAKGCYIIVGTLGRVLITDDGKAWHIDDAVEAYTRISDDPRIAAITFAGTMNYPDGKPDGVDEPEQLSDPADLKVGDWIQWDFGMGSTDEKPVQVMKVDGDEFSDSESPDDLCYLMGISVGYTVVPAPKSQQ